MAPDYKRPDTRDEALMLLNAYGEDALVLAGGTSVMLLLNQGLVNPSVIVDISRLPFGEIRSEAEAVTVGANVHHRTVEKSVVCRERVPLLARAFGSVATVRIRNQATVGGSLAHADPAQDPPVALCALRAQVVVASATGTRRIPVRDFFVDYFEPAIARTELVEAVVLQVPSSNARWTYRKFLPRTQDDYATVSVAAIAGVDGSGRCTDLGLALGSVGATPYVARTAEDALKGDVVSPALIDAAAALVADEVEPLDDLRGSSSYKREMARVWTRRALGEVFGASGEHVA